MNFYVHKRKGLQSQYTYIEFMHIMFPLIPITVFIILGMVFFAIGKDDFRVKKVELVSDSTSSYEKEARNTEEFLE